MGKSARKAPTRHRLLVYQRVSQRLRTLPLLTAFLGLILLGLSVLGKMITLEGADTSMLELLASRQPIIVVLIVACALLYIFAVFLGANSYVEARPKMLHIQTGLLAINISYRRIRQIRLSQVSIQYPEEKLRGNDRRIAEVLSSVPCSIVDLKSWPWPGYNGLKLLWTKFMFSGDGSSVMVVVRDAMVFNQQVDGRLAEIQLRQKEEQAQYLDPLQRMSRMPKKRDQHQDT